MVKGLSEVQIRIYYLSYIHLHTNQRVIRGVFEITSPITTELYDTKSYYQLIVSITKHEELAKKMFSIYLSHHFLIILNFTAN